MATWLLGSALCLIGMAPVAQALRRDQNTAEDALSAADSEPFRVYASSFNAGNNKYEPPSSAEALLQALTAGHESENGAAAADLVIMGFQEYLDNGLAVGEEIRSSYLWQELSKKRIADIKMRVVELQAVPEHVSKAKDALRSELQSFHNKLSASLSKFQSEFGSASKADGAAFRENIVKESVLTDLAASSRKLHGELKEQVEGTLAEHKTMGATAKDKQFGSLYSKAEILAAEAEAYPEAKWIQEAMVPIREWTSSVSQELEGLRSAFPNLAYSTGAERSWRHLVQGSNNMMSAAEDRLQRDGQSQKDDWKRSIDKYVGAIKDAVGNMEGPPTSAILKDVDDINKALARLDSDLGHYVGNGIKDISSAVASETMVQSGQIATRLTTWNRATNRSIDDLLMPGNAEFLDARDIVEVPFQPLVYESGYRCQFGKHFNTMLYVYSNPWSGWKVSPESYASQSCKGEPSGMGCTIDNNEGYECGKVVNLMAFRAVKGDKSLKICALNTHMSYAGKADSRAEMILAAVQEAKKAQCEAVVFVGDVNTRLHCFDEDAPIPSTPFYADDNGRTSLLNVVDTFKDGFKGLPKNVVLVDELRNMLQQKELTCLEKSGDKKKYPSGWKVARSRGLADSGIVEAGVPEFDPTYKVGSPNDAYSQPKGWFHCDYDLHSHMEGLHGETSEPSCFFNNDKKPKHNPAYTDRILLWSKGVEHRTTEYTARPISHTFGSDHVPVVAQVEFEV